MTWQSWSKEQRDINQKQRISVRDKNKHVNAMWKKPCLMAEKTEENMNDQKTWNLGLVLIVVVLLWQTWKKSRTQLSHWVLSHFYLPKSIKRVTFGSAWGSEQWNYDSKYWVGLILSNRTRFKIEQSVGNSNEREMGYWYGVFDDSKFVKDKKSQLFCASATIWETGGF